MCGFVVDVAEVEATATRTATIADDFDTALARLRRDVEDVVSARWRGDAAAAFATAWQRWDGAAQTVVAELARLGDELARTGCDYRVRDAVSAAELRAAS